MSPTRIPGTPVRCPRDGSSLPDDHANAIDCFDPPSRVYRLWLPKPLDRPFWYPSTAGIVPARRPEGRRSSKKLRFQVTASRLGAVRVHRCVTVFVDQTI